MRPRLCKAAFSLASGGQTPDSRIERLCEALECFHKASLIHDDIQDGSEERYGRPTVWKEHGVALAIAAGDWLVAHGYGLIAESGFGNVAAMIGETVRSHVALCEGQGDDLAEMTHDRTREEYLSVCERKTGEPFALAAALGALAVEADPAPYRRYGLDFGILFQLRDDMADGEAPDWAEQCAAEMVRRMAESPLAAALGAWYA